MRNPFEFDPSQTPSPAAQRELDRQREWKAAAERSRRLLEHERRVEECR